MISDKNFKIFILSENANFRNSLATRLRLEGFFVELATGGFHLLHVLEIHKNIDMIICNEDMHDMSAHETISLIRQIRAKNDLPVLFISKTGNEDDIYDLILTGANEYIVQTPNLQSIIERANKYFSQKKPHAA